MMGRVSAVRCIRCGHAVPPGTLGRCPACAGILRPHYSGAAIAQLATIPTGRGLDRYRPVLPASAPLPTLGEGDTPLLALQRSGATLGLTKLHLKVEGANPSGAFKDRPGALAAALALDVGARGVVTASSGNAAAAISAYCAAAGLECAILMEPGNPPAKLRQALATGARIVPVAGVFRRGPDAIADLLHAVAARLNYYLAFVWAPVNPYILEGIKSIAYELAAQLRGAPDVVVCPVGGGDLFTAIWRGFEELQQAGVVDQLPRMFAVQSESAPPLLEAFRSGAERIATLDHASSRISGINVPFTGDHALAAVRASGGRVVGVTDEAVFAAQRSLAREEGVWVEPAGAVALAAVPVVVREGALTPDQTIVCISSGAGFKDAKLAAESAAAIAARDPLPFDADAVVQALRTAES